MIVTLRNSDNNNQIAYAWHEGSVRMPVTSMTNWKRSLRPLTLEEIDIAFETDNTNEPLIVSVHRNLVRNYLRDARTTNGSNRIDSASLPFDASMIAEGMMVCVFGENIGGSGVNFILGYMATASSPSSSPSPSSSVSASPSTSVSASVSLSPSASASASRSASPSPSHSPSASPSSSPSRSISPSVSVSLSPSVSVSRSPSASPSAS